MAHLDTLYLQAGSTTYRVQLYLYLIFPRDSLHSQEFLDSRTAIEAAETAHLGAAVGEVRLVMDGHTVYVDRTVISRQQC